MLICRAGEGDCCWEDGRSCSRQHQAGDMINTALCASSQFKLDHFRSPVGSCVCVGSCVNSVDSAFCYACQVELDSLKNLSWVSMLQTVRGQEAHTSQSVDIHQIGLPADCVQTWHCLQQKLKYIQTHASKNCWGSTNNLDNGIDISMLAVTSTGCLQQVHKCDVNTKAVSDLQLCRA